MGWVEEVRRVLRGESGAAFLVVGLACVFTSMAGMRLNTLVGVYPVDLTLIARHTLGFLSAVTATVLYWRSGGAPVLSKTPRRVLCIAGGCALSLLLRYSESLFITTSPVLVLIGKLCEELFGVLLILAWAERLVPRGFKLTLVCLGASVVLFAGFQILLAFFQRVPCMLMLVALPVISAALFKAHCAAVDVETPLVPRNDTPGTSSWPVAMDTGLARALHLGVVLGFMFIPGQILFPTLEMQQQGVASQLSIALGNGVAGVAVLVLTAYIGYVRTQPRLALSVVFLALFAVTTVAFSLMSYLNGVSMVVCLVLASVATQLAMMLVWASAFARLGSWSPFMMVAAGYACNLLAKTFSSSVMHISQLWPAFPAPMVMGLVLAVVFGLCIACIARVTDVAPGPDGGATLLVDSAAPAKVGRPFKDAIERLTGDFGLTQQEGRVLALCAKGKNARNIAEEMGVSLNTAKSHMRTLYAKLGVHSQQEVIKLVDDEVVR